jgi:hypothetical protein
MNRAHRGRLASRREAWTAISQRGTDHIPWPQPCLSKPGDLLFLFMEDRALHRGRISPSVPPSNTNHSIGSQLWAEFFSLRSRLNLSSNHSISLRFCLVIAAFLNCTNIASEFRNVSGTFVTFVNPRADHIVHMSHFISVRTFPAPVSAKNRQTTRPCGLLTLIPVLCHR